MTTPDLALRPAGADGLGYVETLLERNGLPTDDVREKPRCFYVATVDGELSADGKRIGVAGRVGVGGLEIHDTDGLLRSVVVEESFRGQGYGAAIKGELEEEARSAGVDSLYLLTTTAAQFFEQQGYAEIERTDAPEAIRATAEFETLCPDGATCMRKRL